MGAVAVAEFATPEPIEAVVDLVAGDVRVAAGDRANTVVEVRPSDSARRADVTAAEQARVDYDDGRLQVKTTRRWTSYSPFSDGGAVDVQILLPAGSRLTGSGQMTSFRCTGSLGDCRLKTAVGDIHLERAAAVDLTTAAGEIVLDHATGDARITTGSGLRSSAGSDRRRPAVVKNSNGDTRLGDVAGDLRRAARRTARSRSTDTRSPRSRRSAATAPSAWARSSAGRGGGGDRGWARVEVRAVADGAAAWLELQTGFGRVHNDARGRLACPAAGEDDGRGARPHRRRRHHDPKECRMTPAIEVRDLGRRFGDVTALDRLDLRIEPGSVFGLLGPNEAGKTTIVRIVTTRSTADGRAASSDSTSSHAPLAVRRRIGLAGQYAAVDGNLTGRGTSA